MAEHQTRMCAKEGVRTTAVSCHISRVAHTLSFMYAPISKGDYTARVSHTAPLECW